MKSSPWSARSRSASATSRTSSQGYFDTTSLPCTGTDSWQTHYFSGPSRIRRLARSWPSFENKRGRANRDQAATIDQITRVRDSILQHKQETERLEALEQPLFRHILEKGSLRNCHPIGYGREVGTLVANENRPVLVETRQCRGNARSTEELQLALDDLCEQLSSPDESRPSDLRLPRCVGHMVSDSSESFKILYAPHGSISVRDIVTLKDLVSAKTPSERPCVEDRLCLAAALAQAVLRIHEIGWYHKGIRSSNILFVANPTAQWTIREPLLCGFKASRPENATTLSLNYVLDLVDENDLYGHPSSWHGKTLAGQYRRSYDIYALGAVLTEIGHWASIGDAGYNKWTSERDQRTPARLYKLLTTPSSSEMAYTSPIRDLSFRLGKDYKKATMACINGGFDGSDGLVRFRQDVVSVLDRAVMAVEEMEDI